MLLAGFLSAGRARINVLENRFPRWNTQGGRVGSIVALVGAIDLVFARSRGDLALNKAAERIVAIAMP